LISPSSLKLKILLTGRPGVGKTSWAATAPNPGIAACETGHGDGLLSVAAKGLAYIQPSTLWDFEAICTGGVFKDKDTIVLDSLSAMVKTFIREYAVAMPRRGVDSPKRKAGVPELDDYMVIAEVTRRLLSALLDLDKNIIVTALEKTEKDENGVITGIGPDLPGQLFLGAPALFDGAYYLKTRSKLRIPGQATSRYTEHYLITGADGVHIAKERNNTGGVSPLAYEEVFDVKTGQGDFTYIRNKILASYSQTKAAS
jgi:AAA domain-containing protein